jgi:hypothetical protein
MNMLGVADTNCCFALIDVGTHGLDKHKSDFSNTSFGKAFNSGDLNVPPMRNITCTSVSIPLYFAREEAFLLKPDLMRQFQDEN